MEKPYCLIVEAGARCTTESKTILLIDDCADQLELNAFLLKSEGYELFTAKCGEEALSLLALIGPPDLILLDVQLGEISGPEFLRTLDAQRPELLAVVPVVFFTAQDEVPVSKASGFIRKPVEIDWFLRTVQHFIEIGTDLRLHQH